MKIAVVGPEGTGKSVLAAAIAQALGLTVLAPLREALLQKSGYHTLFEWVAAGNSWQALVRQQAQKEAASADGVIDTGIVDLHALFQRWGWNGSSPEQAEELRELTLAQARRYDRILVTPPRVVAGMAPGRFRSAAHNLQLARLIAALLSEAGLAERSSVIADGPEAARVAQALAFVKG